MTAGFLSAWLAAIPDWRDAQNSMTNRHVAGNFGRRAKIDPLAHRGTVRHGRARGRTVPTAPPAGRPRWRVLLSREVDDGPVD